MLQELIVSFQVQLKRQHGLLAGATEEKARGRRERKTSAHLCRRSCRRDFSHGGSSWWSSSIDDCETDAGIRRSLGSLPSRRPSAPLDFPWRVFSAFSSRSRTPWDPCAGMPGTSAKNCSALLPWRFPCGEESHRIRSLSAFPRHAAASAKEKVSRSLPRSFGVEGFSGSSNAIDSRFSIAIGRLALPVRSLDANLVYA